MWQLPEVKGKSLFRKVDGREKATVKSAFDLSLGTIFIYSISSLDYFSPVYVPLKNLFILK